MATEPNHSKLSHHILKIAFTAILIALVSLSVLFAFVSFYQAKDNLENDLRVLASVLGNRSSAALVFYDQRLASENLRTARFRANIVSACIYDTKGELFAGYSRSKQMVCANIINTSKQDIIIDNEYVSIHQAIIESDETVGYISISATSSQIFNALALSLSLSLAAFIVLAIVTYISLRIRIGRALLPLLSLQETVEKIMINPFSSQRAKALSNDEIGRLVHVFNNMLDTLGNENNALQLSENRFRSLAENSPIGIYELNENLDFVYTNEQWHKLTQIFKAENVEKYQKLIDRKGALLHASVMLKAQSSGESQLIEYQLLTGDSKRIFLEHIAPTFGTNSQREFKGFIGSLMDISELKNAQLELEKLAFYDPLTDLPNRRFFLDHLKFSIADDQHLGILMMDIDNFKKVNDTLGHDAGDEMLRVISERLRGLVSKQDVVCRLGGDEFIILLKGVDVKSALKKIADRVMNAISKPMKIRGHEINTTLSIGVAVYPEDGRDSHELMRNADLALYLSKDSGKNCISFFSRRLQTVVNEKVALESKLRKAIELGHLTFHAQPKLCLATSRLVSAEVLIRWQDPEDGLIPPDTFIPLAEETGLIIAIGDKLIDSVFNSLSTHREALNNLGITVFAINLSARQFYSNSLVDKIESALEKYKLPAALIEFELTESSAIEDIEVAIDIMHKIKALGCKISIDDFGTGYSSLSYLKRFPIDAVKVDRSFISDIPHDKNDEEISSAIIAMGHKLGLHVVAEGVETKDQLLFLKEQNCEYAQGYFIAKPMPLTTMIERATQINTRFEMSEALM